MSDVDYTDTFSDMDQAAAEKSAFTAGLRKALLLQVRTSAGKNGWVRGSDPVLDPLFARAVSGSSADGWTVTLSDAPGVMTTSMFDTPAFAAPSDGRIAEAALDLKAAPASWSKSARWRLEPGPGITKCQLFILPAGPGTGKRFGSLIGSPEFVGGDVNAGVYGSLADVIGLNPSVCRSLAGAPKEVTGNIECVMEAPGPRLAYGPGFLDGAPERVGNNFTVTFPDARKMQRPTTSFLWDGKGNVVPAFTDGVSRRCGEIKVDVPHPGANVAGRRKSESSSMWLGSGSPRNWPQGLYGMMFPDLSAARARVTVYGDAAACAKWLCVMNGLV